MVGENVEVGVYTLSKALEISRELEVDLVEISPNATPPVCKAMDYKKFVYEQKKREKNLKSKEWEKLKSIQGYFELDGCLSAAQVNAVKKLKRKDDETKRDKRQFNSHLNRDRRLDLIYNPAKPF